MAAKGKELYKRGAIWWYRFTNPLTAAQERGSTKTSDRALAQQILDKNKANAWIQAVDTQKLEQSEEPKLWIEATIKFVEVKKKKKSIHTDIGRLKIIAPVMDEIQIIDIDDDLIHRLLVSDLFVRRHIELSTVNRYIDLIRSVLNACERWRWIARAPVLERPGVKAERRRKAWITPKQFFKAHEATTSSLIKDIMMVAVCTGLRAANVIRMHPKWVDIPNKKITVPAKEFKGDKDHTVPLNKNALAVIERNLGIHPERVFTRYKKPVGRISSLSWHGTMNAVGINDELRASGLLSQEQDDDGEYIEHFVLHGMRHTFATWLARAGVPKEIIKTLGGWSSGASDKMVDIYTHTDDVAHLLPYVRKIDAILAGKLKI